MKPKNSNFVDYVKILCRSGKGGAGSAHFLRDRTTAKGGPDGGDGGRGGHIIITLIYPLEPLIEAVEAVVQLGRITQMVILAVNLAVQALSLLNMILVKEN